MKPTFIQHHHMEKNKKNNNLNVSLETNPILFLFFNFLELLLQLRHLKQEMLQSTIFQCMDRH